MNIFLYGPPGSGKSSIGRELAARLRRPFVDSDEMIVARAGLTIPEIFEQQGEAGFRRLESEVCAELAALADHVIALGGGALLDAHNRSALERNGLIICLRAGPPELLARLQGSAEDRPLLAGDDPSMRLATLLAARRSVYDSFPAQVDTSGKTIAQVVDEIDSLLTPRSIWIDTPGLKHEIVLGYGLLNALPSLLTERGLHEPTLVVTDENVARCLPIDALHLPSVVLPAGEAHKTLDTVRLLYDKFLDHHLDRRSIVIALGGGVVGDLTGFAAATFMRGLRWVNVPTSLLAMVDASLGAKTGVDLPRGKNLVGAFHPPALVVSDPLVLATLPEAERISGMAEVVKHGIIGDVDLFESIESSPASFGSIVHIQRAVDVKVRVVTADPFEQGERAKLNLGHTIGHGLEAASDYTLRHGEAVAIGLVGEARLAERIGLADHGLADRIAQVIKRIGLPTSYRGDSVAIRNAMSTDKKKSGSKLKFALPMRIGEVVWEVEVDEDVLLDTLRGLTNT
jgi:3-dehydroquinate synthase